MTQFLNQLFQPSSIAVVGASDRHNSVGMKVFKNLLQENFSGKLYAVNPRHKEIQGQPCFASVGKIGKQVDLAVITTPGRTVPDVITDCGKNGIRAAIVISSGFSETGARGKELEQAMLDAARRYQMRLIGPNCLGVMRPHIKMNATFDNNTAQAGGLALVSQSGALSAAILDWAVKKEIGFSTIASIGNSADVGFGDVLDYLAMDPETKSILLYIEGVRDARRFMSGLRAAARIKPVIAIKGGRNQQGSRAALSHTGALIGNDDVFDVALRRAGVVRVMSIEELFVAAEILSHSHHRLRGNRLAIITNGGGAGVMAADQAAELNITLPALKNELTAKLDKVLPAQWSHQNPIDIIGDATPDRYHAVLDICTKEEGFDAILTMLVPIAMSHPKKVAQQVIADQKITDKLILACWMGEKQVKSSWKLFEENRIPYFDTPEKAVSAFAFMADYYTNQQLLLQVPEPFSPQPTPDTVAARTIIESALASKRTVLTTIESKQVLKAFSIPVSDPVPAPNADEAVKAAKAMGFPVVMKIDSPDITHKQDVGGVRLDLGNENRVREAFEQMVSACKKAVPEARITGVTVERMYRQANDRELMIGVMNDKVFGPVISFGAGGTLVEIIRDRALALPPLNKYLVERLIARTRIARLLKQFRNMPAINMDSLVNILLRVSEMVCELPWIQEMDINPLVVNDREAVAVDARIVAAPVTSTVPYNHMAIHPYPGNLASTVEINGVAVTIRPVRPEDAKMEQEFVRNLSPISKHFRFMEQIRELTPEMLARFTQIDYDREMALIATCQKNGSEASIGIARYMLNPDFESCEFAIVIADEWQNKGLAVRLMNALIECAKARHLKSMMGMVLANNQGMLDLAKFLGFGIEKSDDPKLRIISKQLT